MIVSTEESSSSNFMVVKARENVLGQGVIGLHCKTWPFAWTTPTQSFHVLMSNPNMALNRAPFGRWTLRDKAAQRRLALR
jgi:hypothetical protein